MGVEGLWGAGVEDGRGGLGWRVQVLIQIKSPLKYYMSRCKNIDKGSRGRAQTLGAGLECSEGQSMPLTPIKKQVMVGSAFYSSLSPLPLPPKLEHPGEQVYGSYSKDMICVETPVCKQQHKLLIQDEQALPCHAIVNKIIFESSQEDHNFNSSSVQSSEEEDQEYSQENAGLSFEDKMSYSQQKIADESQKPNCGLKVEEKEIRVKKTAKARSHVKEANTTKKVFCNCKKTKCLKLYCDCFRLNQTCDGCNCTGCHNLQSFAEERNHAILTLMDRNPDPFGQKIEDDKHVKGCNCKKSNCLKKYCQCYQAGLKCGQNCKCEDCKNMPPVQKPGQGPSAGQLDAKNAVAKNTAKKQRKMVEI